MKQWSSDMVILQKWFRPLAIFLCRAQAYIVILSYLYYLNKSFCKCIWFYSIANTHHSYQREKKGLIFCPFSPSVLLEGTVKLNLQPVPSGSITGHQRAEISTACTHPSGGSCRPQWGLLSVSSSICWTNQWTSASPHTSSYYTLHHLYSCPSKTLK